MSYLPLMRAHYKRSKHSIGVHWLRLWLSPIFERASCTNPPAQAPGDIWARKWTDPQTTAEAREALRLCREECPALSDCTILTELLMPDDPPRGVIQAGVSFGVKVGPRKPRTNRDLAS